MQEKMVSFFRISILLFLTIFIQSSLQNKTKTSINNKKDILTSNLVEHGLKNNESFDDVKRGFNNKQIKASNGKFGAIRPVAAGGHGNKCFTRNELRVKNIQHGGQTFPISYYVIVKYCDKF